MDLSQTQLRNLFRWCLSNLFLALLIVIPVDGATRFIEITRGVVNIRTQPSTSGLLVVKARRGDIFELKGEEDGWFRIRLFSGDHRYVHSNLARKVSYQLEVPEQVEIRRQVYKEWFKAEERAQREADRKHPPDTRFSENLEYQQILNDRYKLEMMRKLGVQVPLYRRIILEGNQKRWIDY